MLLRIGAFSRRGRVSVKALRHYEVVGALRPGAIDPATGYRSYELCQLDDLHRLMRRAPSACRSSASAPCSRTSRRPS